MTLVTGWGRMTNNATVNSENYKQFSAASRCSIYISTVMCQLSAPISAQTSLEGIECTVPNNSYRFLADLLHKWSFLGHD